VGYTVTEHTKTIAGGEQPREQKGPADDLRVLRSALLEAEAEAEAGAEAGAEAAAAQEQEQKGPAEKLDAD